MESSNAHHFHFPRERVFVTVASDRDLMVGAVDFGRVTALFAVGGNANPFGGAGRTLREHMAKATRRRQRSTFFTFVARRIIGTFG